MKTRDFYFDLPGHLIAQEPLADRSDSRLMVVNRADRTIVHSRVRDLVQFLPAKACMVFNQSKVRKARLFGQSAGGGRVELIFAEPVGDSSGYAWIGLVRKSGSKQAGTTIGLPGGVELKIFPLPGGAFRLETDRVLDEDWFSAHGRLPLPPYIKRPVGNLDDERYQTVYANSVGSAAAPTAGLHFTEALLDRLSQGGIQKVFIDLQVGLGTFLPVTADRLSDHHMHREQYEIGPAAAQTINLAIAENRPILSVGTTSVRTLESAWLANRGLRPGPAWTDLFIQPGFEFRATTALFTNFHTPESTLFMLVCSFGGLDLIKQAYAQAIAAEYRFFSYGDAMLIL